MNAKNKTIEVLDLIKSIHHLPSDYATAKLWGVSKGSLSNYRNMKTQIGDSGVIKAAKLAEINPTELLASLHIERSAAEDELKVWKQVKKESQLAKSVKKQGFVDALKAAASGKTSPVQRKILAEFTQQCILCKIGQISIIPSLTSKSAIIV